MAVDFIGGSSSALQASSLQTNNLGQEEFLKILLAQLQFQDPLKPLDNQQFLAQMAQFSSLAQTEQMNERIDTLLSIQAATQSVGILGKDVEINTISGAQIGQVTAMTVVDGSPSLTIQTPAGEAITGVRLSQVAVIR